MQKSSRFTTTDTYVEVVTGRFTDMSACQGSVREHMKSIRSPKSNVSSPTSKIVFKKRWNAYIKRTQVLRQPREKSYLTTLDMSSLYTNIDSKNSLLVRKNWRVRYIENLDITNLRGNDQKVRYIEVIVNDWFVTQVTSMEILYC